MLLVDSRVGSKHLLDPLRKRGLPCELVQLDAADVAFEGKGADKTSVMVGIELKKLPDLVQSLQSGRLSGEQIPKLIGPNGMFEHVWMILEGSYRINKQGLVEIPQVIVIGQVSHKSGQLCRGR